MNDESGCLAFLGLIALIAGIYLWVNNVDTIVIREQLPPPEDSWRVVYPKFRDAVNAQLVNTQRMVGAVLDATYELKEQNAELQYSVDLLLDNLGLLEIKIQEEGERQRREQLIQTIAGIFFGWFLGEFVTRGSISKVWRALLGRLKGRGISAGGEDRRVSFTLGAQRGEEVGRCPKCESKMEIQISPKGRKFLRCTNPRCRFARLYNQVTGCHSSGCAIG
ncbi:MAG TPA: hypothetical protein ENI39_00880 [Anaerolineae bacterium]|nr:hypothetical protein [Anaerolineae bacterium]